MASKPPSRGGPPGPPGRSPDQGGGGARPPPNRNSPSRNMADQMKSDARATSLEAGRALQRLLDAAPGAQVAHTIDASTKKDAQKVIDLSGTLEVHVPQGVVTEDHVEQRVEELRRQLSRTQPVAHGEKIELNDEVFLDLLGYLGGEPFIAQTQTWYTVTPNPLLPGLFESFVGVKIPAQRVVHVRLPPTYPIPQQAGRTAVFAVHIKEGRRRELPDLDDPMLLPLLGKGAKTPQQLRDQVRQELIQERALQMVDHAKLLLLRELYVKCQEDDVPTELVEEELTRRWRGFIGESMIRQGVSLEEQQKSREAYGNDANMHAEARRTIWEMRICEAVAEHAGVQVNEAELKKVVGGIFGIDVDLDGVLYKNPQLHKELLKGLRIRRAVDMLLKKAKVFFDAPPTPKDKAYTPLVPPGTERKREERLVVTAARGLKRPPSKTGQQPVGGGGGAPGGPGPGKLPPKR